MQDWANEYKSKLRTSKEAMQEIAPGHRVVCNDLGLGPKVLVRALGERLQEIEGVTLEVVAGSEEEWGAFPLHKGSKTIATSYAGRFVRHKINENLVSFKPDLFSLSTKFEREGRLKKTNVLLVAVSPPDEQGYCSFGQVLFNKRDWVNCAEKVIAEVRKGPMLRTCGDDNRVSVSEIDLFVEGQESNPGYLPPTEVSEELKPLGEYLSTLIRSGDTIQTGSTEFTGNLICRGILDDKEDLGVHTEVVSHGIIDLVKKGIVNGKRKNINPGKVVCTSFYWYLTPELFGFVNENPMFEMRDATYVNDLRLIASHENMVSINGALSMDLMGQMTVETTFGRLLFNGPGGLPEFAIGAMLSKGGRSIIIFPSTALNGTISRIVPHLEEGTAVTLPRTFVDYVVTEYGIASLASKSLRERAGELICIAHPDFREELRRAANALS